MTAPESSPAATSITTRARQALIAWRARVLARWRRRPLLATLGAFLTAVLLVGIGDLGALYARLDRFGVDMPSLATAADGAGADAPETWLLIGTDSRTDLPDGPARYGGVEDVGDGARADVAALVQPSASGLSVLVLPRDLTVAQGQLFDERLATSFLQGPQRTVDALCSTYGIATAHVVTVDMSQFAGIVDSLGGIDVNIDEPVRDTYSGLEIGTAGAQHLNGVDALALVRSRHPQVQRNGQWVALSEQEGAERRSHFTGVVMRSVISALLERSHNPLALQSLAWTLTGNLGVDAGTGLLDLALLARTVSTVSSGGESATAGVNLVEVPAGPVGDGFAAPPTDQTYQTLAAYGYMPGTCTPAD
ncbi:LCP family protein [Actinomyces ruminicola]|uniref:Transcriptional attenuator, LytR family n=1 Tax=Actinomyces ruminicola TaxID=332524 RepID=A0A1G9WIT8_9ACTO|nr:LCP family protein [Actinomyces ruminicola]SDM84086.1 transcriptional attenuator, LytR family [Actinomyces ruminicola]